MVKTTPMASWYKDNSIIDPTRLITPVSTKNSATKILKPLLVNIIYLLCVIVQLVW